ncbi:hypothetical protein ABT104_00510 [Streptomyces mobaraensis]|uniref:hypothetical protein n=1 Tax=Streptomyces mobaraensis TaxID=35621 RepID=UPI0033284BFE
MSPFPGTDKPAPERLTLAQRLKAEHPLIPSAEPEGKHTVVALDANCRSGLSLGEVEAIRATITEALRRVPAGTGVDADVLDGRTRRLNGYMACLLPIAETKGAGPGHAGLPAASSRARPARCP